MGAKILLESETSNTMTVIGVGMVAGGYIWSITDISSGYASSVTNYLTSGRSSSVTGEIPGNLLADTVQVLVTTQVELTRGNRR